MQIKLSAAKLRQGGATFTQQRFKHMKVVANLIEQQAVHKQVYQGARLSLVTCCACSTAGAHQAFTIRYHN